MGQIYQIRFFGLFGITDRHGQDVTPKSKKAQALLALLAEGNPARRNRRWLEDKLWSDRGPEQARGSMRQALFEIRKSLGKDSNLVGSDRNAVWLDPDQFTTDLDQNSGLHCFLEGFDISDPEFNDWLVQKRVQTSKPVSDAVEAPKTHRRIKIQCGLPWRGQAKASMQAQLVDNQIGKILSEFLVGGYCALSEANADLVIQSSVKEQENGSSIFVQVVDPVNDELIHSDHCFADRENNVLQRQDAMGRFCWNIADRALEKLSTRQEDSEILALRAGFVQNAIRQILTFDKDQMFSSLTLLDQAIDYMNDGMFQALRAWALASIILEDFLPDNPDNREEITRLIADAQRLSPNNSMVSAIISAVHVMMFEQFNDALVAAQSALRDNPNNIFALQAMSVCKAKRADYDRAYLLSKHGKTISSFSKFEPMCNLHHALLCLQVGKQDEAQASSELAVEYNAHYRAPKRQLLGLYAAAGDIQRARSISADLAALERDFSIERFLYDRRYPARTLRDRGILDAAGPQLQGLNLAR
jgi:hypothetical protein